MMGLINTNDKRHFFRVTATLGAHTCQFNKVDWKVTSTKLFRFVSEDYELSSEEVDLPEHACIAYEIDRFNLDDLSWENKFAFAVHPLFEKKRQTQLLVRGQFQLPLYYGAIPPAFISGK
jgi:hypothetical protein